MGHNDLDLAAVAHLGDVELMAGLDGLVQQDRALTARLLLHLGEVEARGLHRDRGFSSMFEYAVEAHHMSPDEAYLRLKAAKLAREFPLVLQMLERNQLHLSAIKLLADHLTQANHVALPKPASRDIPHAVVREVYARDAGQCTFVSPEGRRCAARGHLELHHEDPYARGGPPTVQNLKLLCAAKQIPLGCRSHNALMAERDFGRDFMRDKRTRVRAGTECSGPEQSSQLDPCSRTQLHSAPTDKRLKAQREAE